MRTKFRLLIAKSQWSFLAFFGIFELGSLLCGIATSSVMLIVGRAVAGLGSAGIVNGALTIISSSTPKEKRPGMQSRLAKTSKFEVTDR